MIDDKVALELLTEAEQMHARLGSSFYEIKTRESYEEAAELLKRVKGKEKDLETRRVYLKAPSLEAGRRIDEWFKRPLGFLRSVEDTLKGAMLGFRKAQEAEAKRLQAIADAAAAEEQRRLARAALEARMKADVEAQALAAQAQAAKDRVLREKLNLEAQARLKRASEAGRQLEDQAERVQAPIIKADKPKIDGQVIRRVWRWAVEDFAQVPDEYKALDAQAVQAHVWAREREGWNQAPEPIAGLRFYLDEIIASEGKR
jgi:hypothetical protein